MNTDPSIPNEASEPVPDRSSTALSKTPLLGTRGLTWILMFMCLVPMVTIYVLWQMMPPVYEGQLEASVSAIDLPDAEFYVAHYSERPEFTTGELVVKNESDQDWTHLNITVNRHYQIYDTESIPAHSERNFKLEKFVSRTGARFQLRYNRLESVRIYARRPTKDRATFYYEFEQPIE